MLLITALTLSMSGCTKTRSSANDTVEIPASYYEFFGDTPADDVEAVQALGPAFCTRCYRSNGGMVMKLSPRQRENLRSKYLSWIHYYTDELESAGENYQVIGSKDYRVLTLVFDEKLDVNSTNELVQGLSYYYVLNQLLDGAGENWSLDLRIKNCNTGKLVAKVKIPEQNIDFSGADWDRGIDE